MIKQPASNVPRHRRALFRIKCKILGKVCKVMVDLRLANNVIPKEVVTKLKLKKIPHDNPYKVTWLKKGQSILVNEKAWVDFLIAGYKD